MKKVYDPELVTAAINASKHREMLRSVNAEIFLAEYNPREYVVMLPEPSPMFQIIISGELSCKSFLRRLFLVITRLYKSFKSLTANLPPSS